MRRLKKGMTLMTKIRTEPEIFLNSFQNGALAVPFSQCMTDCLVVLQIYFGAFVNYYMNVNPTENQL
jgi:hypothetical protein